MSESESEPIPGTPDTPGLRRRTFFTGAAGIGLAAAVVRPPGWRPKVGAPHPAAWLPNTLTNQQLAGQRVIYSYPGTTPPSSLYTALSSGQAAGVIFFGENISSESQIAGIIKKLRAAAAQSPVKTPPLLMTDQEGGLVRRLPGAPTLSEKQVGASSNPVSAATTAGTGAGQNLAGVGMNVNLAPVLDVFYQSGNFIDQYQRSYSNNPAVAAECGQAFITAQQATGVAATAKHFPGLGSATASQNTDSGPVTLNVSLTQLHTIDEVPYPPAISAGVKLVMVSWAVYPALDPSLPAGLSPAIVGQELRGRLGFTGVTVTDAIEAGALTNFGTTGQRSVSAAQAGMDLILCSARDVTQGQAATSALATALGNGTLDPTRFNDAANRVFQLRSQLF
ncbi:MAG TPA: glycoside hydrolase family 3 N-terminal domain-containing protein [Actinocrinis sp.]|uniref:glycoside hydrolase family 3 N-terminal domain-containing protein n=1 Tax=Actinocrinis sp. TaxID=1920516 RepID=UPI002DDDAAB3|nr:glycoside hydrolase family 3 N-terminal domain-containing protein [Actinocrinis sp.]HEV2345685.1 glycoside hydrolase family 3 N-terminal domain-containing protein [Actinocrinis sp.]